MAHYGASSDGELKELGKREMAKIGLLDASDIEDAVVIRTPKAYPAYFGSYARSDVVRDWVDGVTNLFLVGRNGMHRYNNQDHSILTAQLAVDNIFAAISSKTNIWTVNVGDDYHEEGQGSDTVLQRSIPARSSLPRHPD